MFNFRSFACYGVKSLMKQCPPPFALLVNKKILKYPGMMFNAGRGKIGGLIHRPREYKLLQTSWETCGQ